MGYECDIIWGCRSMSKENFEIIKKIIQAGRLDGIEQRLAKLLMYEQLTPEEYQQAFDLLKNK